MVHECYLSCRVFHAMIDSDWLNDYLHVVLIGIGIMIIALPAESYQRSLLLSSLGSFTAGVGATLVLVDEWSKKDE